MVNYYSAHCRDPGTCVLLAEKLRAGETRVVLPGLFRSVRETQAVVRAVMLDHPELFWVNYYRYSVIDTLLGQYLMLGTFFSPAEQEELRCQAEAWRGRVLAQLPAAVDEERLLRLLADYPGPPGGIPGIRTRFQPYHRRSLSSRKTCRGL